MHRRWSNQPFTRRSLLKGTSAAALGAMAMPLLNTAAQETTPVTVDATPTTNIRGTELKILQWQHFVPRYDKWFDPFVKAWGEKNGVKVSVDHINTADVPATFASEIAAKQGHDLVEHIAPMANLEPSLVDLTDLINELNARHGQMSAFCQSSSYNPLTKHYFSVTHGFAPDPGDYRKSLWDKAGMGNGPTTWDDLITAGSKIKSEQGINVGIGMSNEIDSNMAGQALMWCFGASVQDKDSNVTLNSPETVAAVEYMVKLYKQAMTPEVFGWNAASNNQALIAGRASYILNSISAYRTAQTQQPNIAKDVFFTKALKGPSAAYVNGHAVINYMIPNYSKNIDTAKEFILYLVANYNSAVYQSELYHVPAWHSTAPDLLKEGGWFDNDPFGSDPPNKLAVLKDAESWTVNVGYPGPTNATLGDVIGSYLIPKMFAQAAQGGDPKTVVADTAKQVEQIAAKWRKAGLVGGTK